MKTKLLPSLVAALALASFTPLLQAGDAAQRTAAAEELLKAMHIEEMMAKQKENMSKMISSFSPKESSEETRKKALQRQTEIFDTLLKWDTLKPDFIQIYSEVYTEQELKDLTTFYKSPIGQKFIEKMPELQKKTLEIMQKRMLAAMPEIQKAAAAAKASASPAAK